MSLIIDVQIFTSLQDLVLKILLTGDFPRHFKINCKDSNITLKNCSNVLPYFKT